VDGAEVPASQEVHSSLPSVPTVDLPATQGSHTWASTWPVAAEALPWPHSTQPWPATPLYVPLGQVSHALQSALLSSPASQSWQSEIEVEPVPPMYLPLAHVVQAAAAADPMYLPTSQSAQAAMLEEPSLGLLLPATQSIHVEPASSLYLPIPQLTHAVSESEPVPAVVVPASQPAHCELPVTPFHLPNGHVSHAPPLLAAPQPTLQSKLFVQPVCSSFANGAGLTHAVQDVLPGASVYVAPSQMVQTLVPSCCSQNLPAMQFVQSVEVLEPVISWALPVGQAAQASVPFP